MDTVGPRRLRRTLDGLIAMNNQESSLQLLEKSRPLFAAMERIAGFELPATAKNKFLAFHTAVTRTPRLPVLVRLTIEGGSRRDWLQPFINAGLGHVQEGLAASYYHVANVDSIEREIINLASVTLGELKIPRYSGVGGGNTRRLDFEYQAFVFALRRSMEYFAVSVGTFFKRPVHRIRALANSLEQAEPLELSQRVQTRLNESLQSLSDLLPPADNERAVRDQLAHWKAVAAGVFNISAGPDGTFIGIAGGGENIQPWDSGIRLELRRQKEGSIEFTRLAPVLQDQVSRVESMIFGIYDELGLMSTP
jgi:hypothetical protein